jgi:hypothetical protein
MARRIHAPDLRLEGGGAIVAGAALGAIAVIAKTFLLATIGDPGYILMLSLVVAAAWTAGVLGGLTALVTSAVIHALLLVASPFE